MRFSQNTYTGTIRSTGLTAESIVLSLGYAPGTQFILTGGTIFIVTNYLSTKTSTHKFHVIKVLILF